MLHSYRVFNYPPYLNGVELSLHPSPDINHENHIIKDCDKEVVRNIAIFGLNDSGKSMFIQSFETLQKLITDNDYAETLSNLFKMLEGVSTNKNIKYEIEFSINNHLYTYVVSISPINGVEEHLFLNNMGQLFPILLNESNQITIFHYNWSQETHKIFEFENLNQKLYLAQSINNIYRIFKFDESLPNKELLTKMWNDCLCDVVDWFKKIIFVHSDSSEYIKSKPEELSLILKHFDTGIESVEIKDVSDECADILKMIEEQQSMTDDPDSFFQDIRYMSDGSQLGTIHYKNNGNIYYVFASDGKCKAYKILFHHKGIQVPLESFNESEGTLRLLDFHELLFSKDEDVLFIVDELDRKLHPLASQELIRLFNSKTQRKQQLIFTTHESSLLSSDFLRDDEVRFILKNHKNISTMNSIVGHNEFIYAISENEYLDGSYDKIFENWRNSE